MHKQFNSYIDQSGMTLVEILVSLVILGLVLTTIFPLVTDSLQVTNLANSITSRLLGDQENIEIVAVTKDGAYLEDGTFIPESYYPVVLEDGTTWVPGMTIKKADLIRFLAANLGSEYELFEVYEGYTEEEAQLTIEDRSFTQDSEFVMVDKDGNEIDVDISVSDGQSLTFSLPIDTARLTNLHSPYHITITTDDTEISSMLLVHLPRAVIVNSNGNLLISSSSQPGNWINKTSTISNSYQVNKICFVGNSEQTARYIAVGNGGSIYLWENGEQVFRKLSLSSGIGTTDLNDILATDDGLLVVGDDGLILHSLDGSTWEVRRSKSNNQPDLNAIAYFTDKEEYVCVGESGIILISSDAEVWTQLSVSGYPQLSSNAIHNKKAVLFSETGDHLMTPSAGMSGDNSRTIFMVVKPTAPPANIHLLTMGSPNKHLTLRTDSSGNLSVETGSISHTSSFTLAQDAAYIISCRYDQSTDILGLSVNGSGLQEFNNIQIDTDGDSIYLGNNLLTNYNDPLYFEGAMAEVFVFNRALSSTRSSRSWPSSGSYASEMDVANKYLSLKYGITLQDSSISNTYYYGTIRQLNENNWRSNYWPSNDYRNMDQGVLWLNTNDFNLGAEQQVRVWSDNSGANNHATVTALYAAACNDQGDLYAAGYHRHMIRYESDNDLSQDNENLNSQLGPPVQYSLDDMLYVPSLLIGLLNDSLATGETTKGYIAAVNRPGSNYDLKVVSDYRLNDIFYYSDADTVVVVGNSSSIFYSENDGVNWYKDDSVTTSYNLTAICLR